MNIAQTNLKEHILRLAQKLPTAPQIFAKLCVLLDDLNSDPGRVVELIGVDTGLTARVLRLSNSVFFRGSLSVESLDEAINRVGFREVHKIVGIAMTEQAFKDGLPAYHLNAKEIFENSVATALAMELIAGQAGEDEHEAYTVGLLRQIGKLVLGRILEKERPGTMSPMAGDIAAWETAEFGVTSHEVTAQVLESWKLPASVFMGIRHHHAPEVFAKEGPLGAILHLACWVANEMGKGLPSEASLWALTPERLARAGVNEEFVRECVQRTEIALCDLREQLGIA
ncbi:MAG: HDOD domain-containing protein [Nibricoccus sp.]